VRLSSIKHIL